MPAGVVDVPSSFLPDKASALIRSAIADLRKVEVMPDKYNVDMASWHEHDRRDSKCQVCLAGAVMAMTLQCPYNFDGGPSTFVNEFYNGDQKLRRKLTALSGFMFGDIHTGLTLLGVHPSDFGYIKRSRDISRCGEAFHNDMIELANDLEVEGL